MKGGGVSLLKRPRWAGLGRAGLGWADPSPVRGGTPGEAGEQSRWGASDGGEALWQERISGPASTGGSRDIPR